jgi:hypothetical protein
VFQASQREELLSELDDDGNSLFSGGVWNNVLDISLTSITVVASLVATALATTDSKDVARWMVAIIAAIPARSGCSIYSRGALQVSHHELTRVRFDRDCPGTSIRYSEKLSAFERED